MSLTTTGKSGKWAIDISRFTPPRESVMIRADQWFAAGERIDPVAGAVTSCYVVTRLRKKDPLAIPTGTIPEKSPREGYYPPSWAGSRAEYPRSLPPFIWSTLEPRPDPINNELPQSFVKLTAGQTNARRGSVVGLNGRDQREASASSTAAYRVASPPALREAHVTLTRRGSRKANGSQAIGLLSAHKAIDETKASRG